MQDDYFYGMISLNITELILEFSRQEVGEEVETLQLLYSIGMERLWTERVWWWNWDPAYTGKV